MNATALNQTIALGAITGIRSMAGPAAMALRHDGVLPGMVAMMAAGEMMLDKTAVIGDRIDPLPLAGRAIMGAIVGGIIARENRGSMSLGGLIGATAAVITAHLAYRARRRIPGASALGGLVEDAIVVAVGAYAGTAVRRVECRSDPAVAR